MLWLIVATSLAASEGKTAADLGCAWAKGEPAQIRCDASIEGERYLGRKSQLKFDSLEAMQDFLRGMTVCDAAEDLAKRYGFDTHGLKVTMREGRSITCRVDE